MRKPTRGYVECEIEVKDDGAAYRFSLWSSDGRPISAQQIMDAVSDAVLMEFGVEHMTQPDDELPH